MVEKIRSLCRERGMSFWALERELGIGNGVIAKWAKSSPRVETVKLVADYFGVTVDELLAEQQTAEQTKDSAQRGDPRQVGQVNHHSIKQI